MKKILTLLLIMTVICISLSGCGKENLTGYSKMTNINGITFYVPTTLNNSATAVTAITPDSNYDYTSTYTYKDTDSFLIFRMSEMVIVVKKGNTFNLSSCANNSERQNAIINNDLLGIWFHIPNKFKDSSEETNGASKYSCTINAEVIITNELYDNFTGKLSVIEANNTEYCIFAGYVGSDYNELEKEQQESIDTIINAFKLNTSAPQEQEMIEVSETVESSEPVSVTEPSSTSESTVEEKEEPTSTDDVEIVIDVPETDSEILSEEESDDVEIVIDVPEAEEESEPISTPEEEKEPESTQPKPTIVLDNQNANEENSIYNMLSLNETSKIDIMQGYNVANVSVKPTAIYTEQEAISIIQNHCKKEDTLYEYTEPPVGCSWEVVRYTISYQQNDMYTPYVNIKIVGLDGESLKFRGITYSKRTHDILISENITNGTVTKELYCFYAVPNGCNEYTLEIGDGTIHNNEESAYYLIQK